MLYIHHPKKFRKTVKRIFTPSFIKTLNEGEGTAVVNWGSLEECKNDDYPTLNEPKAVLRASNKLRTLETLEAHSIPALYHTVNTGQAKEWINQGHTVFGRRLIAASKGKGIELLTEPQQCDATFKLYTRNFPKTHEYRIFATPSRIIDFVQKKRRYGVTVDGKIRTHSNGWVFCHGGITQYRTLKNTAMRAVQVLGLDFAAVDVLAVLTQDSPRELKNYRVCEVNTAPGIDNTETIAKFQEYFADVLKDW